MGAAAVGSMPHRLTRLPAGSLALCIVLAGAVPALADDLPKGGGVESVLRRINADIHDGTWIDGRTVLLTPDLGLARDGRLELRALGCRSERDPDKGFVARCRQREAPGVVKSTVIDPAGIDPSTIHVHAADNGSVEAAFVCRGGTKCVALPDGSKTFDRASLVCNDPAACNRVVGDLASLLDLLAQGSVQQANAETVLERVNGLVADGAWIDAKSMSITLRLALVAGDKLEAQNTVCDAGLADYDESDIEACRDGEYGLYANQYDFAQIIDPAGVDRSTLQVQDAAAHSAKGFSLEFKCREAVACVVDKQNHKTYGGSFLVCNDQEACQSLAREFGLLLDLLSRRKGTAQP